MTQTAEAPTEQPTAAPAPTSTADLVKGLVDAGIHFGHPVSRWNPRMEPYIHGKRGNIHVIDIRETVKGLLLAKRLIAQTVANGRDVLFVGTKRQARSAVEEQAARAGMHYVSERWLGGTLTNFRTIRQQLNRLDTLEKLWNTGTIETYSKKMKATLGREKDKISANLSGIRRMEKLPGVMFIIDTRREHIAVKEAKKLGVTTIALIDTDSDPSQVDLPVPGNDDAMRAIEIVMREMADAALTGKQGRPAEGQKQGPDGGPQGERQRGRSSRAQFRAGTEAPETVANEGGEPNLQVTRDESPVAPAPEVVPSAN